MAANPVKIINGLVDVQSRVGEFIANGPSDGLAGYIRDQYRKRCNQAANVPPWLLALSPIARQSLSNFCSPYYDSQGVDGPVLEPPFNGGQCDAVYVVRIAATRNDSNPPTEVSCRVRGPIEGVRIFDSPPAGIVQIRAFNTISSLSTCGSLNSDSLAWRNAGLGGAAYLGESASIVSITPCGNDSCGDPPPQLRPGNNPPEDPGPTPGPEPRDDPDGGPFPELPIPPWPGPLGDYPIEPPPNDQPPAAPGGDGLPGVDDAIGDEAGEVTGGEDGEEVDFGPPPKGRVWIGAFIQAVVDSRLGNIPGTGPTATVYPFVIGNCALRYGNFFGTSHRIQSRQTLLARPTSALVLDGAFVQAQPGVTLSVRPVSAPTCPENPCGDDEDG